MSQDRSKPILSRRRFIQGLGASAGLVAALVLISSRLSASTAKTRS